MIGQNVYIVKTNLPPEQVMEIGVEVFLRWMSFAIGATALENGKKIMYPSGRYASSISIKKTGEASVAIVADESIAPEAAVLESGHAAIDLKTKLQHGRPYPMHRAVGGNVPGLRRVGSGPPGFSPRIWAEVKQRESSGFASIGPNSPAGSWIIPPMVAYSPAAVLASMAQQQARKIG